MHLIKNSIPTLYKLHVSLVGVHAGYTTYWCSEVYVAISLGTTNYLQEVLYLAYHDINLTMLYILHM